MKILANCNEFNCEEKLDPKAFLRQNPRKGFMEMNDSVHT